MEYRIIYCYNKNTQYMKMVYYKDKSFIQGYHSNGKSWKTIKGVEKALIKISKTILLYKEGFYGIEDSNGNIIKWFDIKNKQFIY